MDPWTMTCPGAAFGTRSVPATMRPEAGHGPAAEVPRPDGRGPEAGRGVPPPAVGRALATPRGLVRDRYDPGARVAPSGGDPSPDGSARRRPANRPRPVR